MINYLLGIVGYFLALLAAFSSLSAQTVLWPTTEEQLTQKTIGRVSPEAVRKANGSFEEYIARRGLNSAAGKGFEALTAIRYNRLKTDRVLFPTASLGDPAHPLDLVLFDRRTSAVQACYQAKLGKSAAIEALNNPKYAGAIIVLPPDELAEIIETIQKRQARGRGLSPALEQANRSIANGRLTATIDGMTLPTRDETKRFTLEYLRKAFERTVLLGML